MKFGTVINCMDGRVQLPVLTFLQDRFNVDCVDSITEAGPIKMLSEQPDGDCSRSILNRLAVSVLTHGSVGIAVVGHFDCAGNPVSKDVQLQQIADSIGIVRTRWPDIEITGLWVDESWTVDEWTVHALSDRGFMRDA